MRIPAGQLGWIKVATAIMVPWLLRLLTLPFLVLKLLDLMALPTESVSLINFPYKHHPLRSPGVPGYVQIETLTVILSWAIVEA